MQNVIISNDESPEAEQFINRKMYEFNAAHFDESLHGRYRKVNLFVKDEEGGILGGILCEICWDWMEVKYLFIEDEKRKSGLGRRLLSEAEKVAAEKGCTYIKLDTLSFQAFDFYRKMGYQEYGRIENAGGKFSHHYLKKDL
ncbi:GNAT family N-acetyltransferase [Peribacillus sp. SCS-37]|uniref:GNAT family N-acetyltransferase n=1 Tax=Paraperibacillus esterisolvens TaxID=3115296 RepID=UPI00390646C5